MTSAPGALDVGFTSGSGTGVVADRFVALVEGGPDDAAVATLVRLAGATLDEVLGGLAALHFSSLPAFGLVAWDGDLCRVVLRGEVEAAVRSGPDDDAAMVDGVGVRTWSEHAITDATDVVLSLRGSVGGPAGYRATGGIVPAATMHVVSTRVTPSSAPFAPTPAPTSVTETSKGAPAAPAASSHPEVDVARFTADDLGAPPGVDAASDGIDDGLDAGLAVDGASGAVVDVAPAEAFHDAVDVVASDVVSGADDAVGAVASDVVSGADDAVGAVDDASSHDPSWRRDEGAVAPHAVVPAAASTNAPQVDRTPASDPAVTLLGVDDVLDGGSGAPVVDGDVADAVGTAERSAVALAVTGTDRPVERSGNYDHLFGATEHRSVESAAVRADDAAVDGGSPAPPPPSPSPSPSPPAAPPPTSPDHDGMTMTVAELRRLTASAAPDMIGGVPVGDPPPATAAASPVVVAAPGQVLAARCEVGHLNPPHAGLCRACGAVVGDDVVAVDRLELGRFVFSSGQVVTVAGPLLIGRSPRMSGPVRGALPELVSVPSPQQDISRTHVEVRIEGWQVLVVDRGSTNGTMVLLDGRPPQRLRPDEAFPLPIGGRVSLADEVEFVYEAAT